MGVLTWLGKAIGREPPVPAPTDPWREAQGMYLKEYRRYIENVVDLLSSGGENFSVRINRGKKCAEIFRPQDDQVAAEVRVHGSEGAPYEMIVKAFFLPEGSEMTFREKVPLSITYEIAA